MPYLVKRLSATTFLLFLLLAWVSQDSVHAQVLYGGLTGNVTDSSGAAVPGVLVSALHGETNQSRDAITNDVGRYTFATLPSGRYTLPAKLTGFKEARQTGVELRANIVAKIDFTLEVGGITEQVTVESAAVTLQTE